MTEETTEQVIEVDGVRFTLEVTAKGQRVLDLVRAGVSVREAIAFVDAEERAVRERVVS